MKPFVAMAPSDLRCQRSYIVILDLIVSSLPALEKHQGYDFCVVIIIIGLLAVQDRNHAWRDAMFGVAMNHVIEPIDHRLDVFELLDAHLVGKLRFVSE